METPNFWRDMEAPDFGRRVETPKFRAAWRDMEAPVFQGFGGFSLAAWKPQISRPPSNKKLSSGGRGKGARAGGLRGFVCDKSEALNRGDQGLNLSGSWQQGHSATYNTPSRI